MSFYSSLLNLAAASLRRRRKRELNDVGALRILVIRRNRMGDMLNTLPLLHALRRHQPRAHISVACDPPGAPIAEACESVNDVITLVHGWNRWHAAYRNASVLQDYDCVIAAKGGFDRRLAVLARLTNAPMRIGFERPTGQPSLYYTDPIELPPEASNEHQIETLLRLARPLGLVRTTAASVNLRLKVPEASLAFAAEVRAKPPFPESSGYVVINFSSTVELKFREEDFIALARRILSTTNLAVVLVAAPVEQQLTQEVAMCMGSRRVIAIDTPGPLDLAALLEKAIVLFTPEGGAAHLAGSVNTPALVLWSEGPFEKWRSRGRNHAYIHAAPGEALVPLDRVWQALVPFLHARADSVDEAMEDAYNQPTPPEHS
jgi:ADP-heptose:LPS heptosyltransferase